MENWGPEEVERGPAGTDPLEGASEAASSALPEEIPDAASEAEPGEGGPSEAAPEGEDGQSGAKPRRDTSGGREMYLNIRVLVGMMTVFVLLFTFVARIIVVSGPSMEDTLQNGDLILVWSLGYSPKQGDVVVLTQESYQEDSIVKRVIATEGQKVDIDYIGGVVYVDGLALEEDYTKETMLMPSYGEGINHVTVPEGHIFVMGDNRNQSADSRYPGIGIVDVRCVIGHGVAVMFPFHHWKGL